MPEDQKPKFPLKVNKNQRYPVDQNNIPFLLQGDAPWSLFVGPSREEAELYLANRSEKHFNSLLVNLIEHKFCKDPPNNFYGEGPFTEPDNFATPNEKYFAHVDWVIKKAADYDIQILLCPVFLGVSGTDHGWYEELVKLSLGQCLEYGCYLGKRYSGFGNITWSIGADRNPERDGLERLNLIALGIKEFDRRHLMTAQCYPESSSIDIFPSGNWLDLNATYSYEIVHRKIEADYNHSLMPTFLIETTYEGEHNSSQAQIRRQAYWAVLCGGFGHVFGNFAIWPFGVEFGNGADWPHSTEKWQVEMDKPGSIGMMHWGNLFRSRQWYRLVPDQKHKVVTKGLGEFRGLDYLVAGISDDGKLLIAYMPTARTITIDLSQMKADRVVAWWYDPRTGKTIREGELSTDGAKEFTPPSDGDWAIVVDDASNVLSPPGQP